MSTGHRGPSLLAVAMLVGCAPTDAPPSTTQVRDSAGVRVIEIPAGPVDTFRVAEPLLTIGHEGDANYEFSFVRDVVALSDGRIAVADRGATAVRYYDPDGAYIGRVGRAGEGPGEFRLIGSLQVLSGDTVAVLDGGLRRVSFLTPDARFARAVSWIDHGGDPEPGGVRCAAPGVDGVVGDERRLLVGGWRCLHARGAPGPVTEEGRAWLWTPGAEVADTNDAVASFDLWERPDRAFRESYVPLRYVAATTHASWEGGVLTTSHRAYEVRIHGRRGRLRAILRDLEPLRPTTSAVEVAWAAAMDSTTVADYRSVPFPDSLPAFYRGLHGDGRSWARHYDLPGSPEHWRVYAADGSRVGVVAFPPGFRLTSVRDGRAYGFVVGDLGIQRPRVYAAPGPLGPS